MLLVNQENPILLHTYGLSVICNQLSAMFNFTIRTYNLPKNPLTAVGKIGLKDPESEMLFWTKSEYLSFSKVMEDEPIYYHAFELLYWTVHCYLKSRH